MRSSPSPNQRFAGAVACAMALGVILYINTLHGPFMGDDAVEIQQNPGVHRLSGIPHQLVSGFTGAGTGGNYLYRPLTSIMSTVLWVLGGGRPEAFHLWNILIHSLCAGLVVVLLARLGAEAPAALIAGAFFAAHPIHTEAVARLSGHAETMACALVLIAWIAHLRARWLLAAGAFGVGLLAKESAIVFPALAIGADLLPPRASAPSTRSLIGRVRYGALAAYLVVLAAYLAVRLAVLGRLLGGGAQTELRPMLNPLIDSPASVRALMSLKILAVAVRQSVFPRTLCADYGFNQLPIASRMTDPGVGIGLLVLVVVAVLIWLSGARRRWMALAAVLFFVAYLPTSNLLFPGVAIFAERNLYLPVLGFCMAAAVLLAGPRWSPRWRWLLAGALVLAMGARTVTRNEEFRSILALDRAGVASCPSSAWAHYSLGVALRDAGDLDGSFEQQRASLAISPGFSNARAELGLTLLLQGRPHEAEMELKEAVRLNADDWQARANLALLYADSGRLAESIEMYEAAMKGRPAEPALAGNYASALIEAGRIEEARGLFEKLRAQNALSAVGPNGLGALAAREGHWDQAAAWFAEAVHRDPGDVNALYNQAQALSRTGRLREAVALLENAAARGAADEACLTLLADLKAAAAAAPPR